MKNKKHPEWGTRGTCKYVGPSSVLDQKTALYYVSDEYPDMVKVQFNDLELGVGVTHNWVYFPKNYFIPLTSSFD